MISDVMIAGGGTGSECSSDNYLQFGRDILFVTTHLSEKLCYNHTVINNRQYVEIEVRVTTQRVFFILITTYLHEVEVSLKQNTLSAQSRDFFE